MYYIDTAHILVGQAGCDETVTSRSIRKGQSRVCPEAGVVTLTRHWLLARQFGLSGKRCKHRPSAKNATASRLDAVVHAIWIYVRFNLNLREVEEMLLKGFRSLGGLQRFVCVHSATKPA